MTSRDFCYWLQGFFELRDQPESKTIDMHQLDIIKKHLAMVFRHEIDPSFGDKKHQEELTKVHEGKMSKVAEILKGIGPWSEPPKFNC